MIIGDHINTTIAIATETREELKQFGNKGDTYDSIIKELMEIAKYHGFLEAQKSILKKEKFQTVDNL